MSRFNFDTDFCKQCGLDGGLCNDCVKKKYYQQGRADERKKILDILNTFTKSDYNSKECKLLVSDLREVLWEGEQNDK